VSSPIRAEDVEAAAVLLHDLLDPTPLQPSARHSTATGAHVLLKREDLQPVRSYKLRGAYTLIARLSPEQRAKGVVAGYFAGADGIFDNPSADPGGATLEAVAEGSAKTVASTRANRLILAERAQTGRTEITDLTITSLDLTFDDSKKITVWPTVRLSGCIDRYALKTVDASGSPVKDPALRSVRATFSVRNTSWPSRDGWRLSWFTESKTRC